MSVGRLCNMWIGLETSRTESLVVFNLCYQLLFADFLCKSSSKLAQIFLWKSSSKSEQTRLLWRAAYLEWGSPQPRDKGKQCVVHLL